MICPQVCSRFDKCSAPVCPLDPESLSRVHLPDDRVCKHLRTYSRNGSRANSEGGIPKELLVPIARNHPDILVRFPDIRKQVHRSARLAQGAGRESAP